MFRLRAYLTNTYLASFDLAVTATCYFVVRREEFGAAGNQAGPASLGFVLSLWLVLSFYFGMYRSRRLDSPVADLITLLKVGLASWVVVAFVSPLLPGLA